MLRTGRDCIRDGRALSLAEEIEAITAPLKNCDPLPDHPADTTGLKIVYYGTVRDASDGTKLRAGIHRNELKMLMEGNQMALTHLYAYVILNKHIYHFRKAVVIEVKCVPNEPIV